MKQFTILSLLFIFVHVSITSGQPAQSSIRDFLETPGIASRFNSIARLKEFYNFRAFRPVWTNQKNINQFLIYFGESNQLGLEKNDYQPKLVESLNSGRWYPGNLSDSIWMETGLTDAVLHFLLDVATGAKPPFAYDGLNLSPDYSLLMKLINDAVEQNGLATIVQELEPSRQEYRNIKVKMQLFQRAIGKPGFKDVIVSSNRADTSNKPLLRRLQQLGELDSIPENFSGKHLKEKIKVIQRMFNLIADGVIRSTLLDEMNIPLRYRIGELKMTLNTMRWLAATTTSSTIVVVNIPSANLLVYDKGQVIMESRVIVGKRTTPTSTLSSRILEVILYPYWVVPKKIVTRELLPIIKRNIGYLDANAIQVINLEGKVMNPYRINWAALSPSYFPYILRQSTGCDNSLGLVKLNFYNPFTTYLHDTPWKILFRFNKRYFSHGCIRVEKAIELARLVLNDNRQAIDTVTEKGCLKNQSPITIQATNAIPVFVLYQTAWVDSSATVRFEEDVYQRLRYLRSPTRLINKSLAVK